MTTTTTGAQPVAICCPPIAEAPLSPDDATALAAAFKALGDPARLRLLSLLAAQPDQEACVCDLIEPVALTQPTVSHHLRVLHEAGLVTREKRGTFAWYRLVPARFAALRDALEVPNASIGAA